MAYSFADVSVNAWPLGGQGAGVGVGVGVTFSSTELSLLPIAYLQPLGRLFANPPVRDGACALVTSPIECTPGALTVEDVCAELPAYTADEWMWLGESNTYTVSTYGGTECVTTDTVVDPYGTGFSGEVISFDLVVCFDLLSDELYLQRSCRRYGFVADSSPTVFSEVAVSGVAYLMPPPPPTPPPSLVPPPPSAPPVPPVPPPGDDDCIVEVCDRRFCELNVNEFFDPANGIADIGGNAAFCADYACVGRCGFAIANEKNVSEWMALYAGASQDGAFARFTCQLVNASVAPSGPDVLVASGLGTQLSRFEVEELGRALLYLDSGTLIATPSGTCNDAEGEVLAAQALTFDLGCLLQPETIYVLLSIESQPCHLFALVDTAVDPYDTTKFNQSETYEVTSITRVRVPTPNPDAPVFWDCYAGESSCEGQEGGPGCAVDAFPTCEANTYRFLLTSVLERGPTLNDQRFGLVSTSAKDPLNQFFSSDGVGLGAEGTAPLTAISFSFYAIHSNHQAFVANVTSTRLPEFILQSTYRLRRRYRGESLSHFEANAGPVPTLAELPLPLADPFGEFDVPWATIAEIEVIVGNRAVQSATGAEELGRGTYDVIAALLQQFAFAGPPCNPASCNATTFDACVAACGISDECRFTGVTWIDATGELITDSDALWQESSRACVRDPFESGIVELVRDPVDVQTLGCDGNTCSTKNVVDYIKDRLFKTLLLLANGTVAQVVTGEGGSATNVVSGAVGPLIEVRTEDGVNSRTNITLVRDELGLFFRGTVLVERRHILAEGSLPRSSRAFARNDQPVVARFQKTSASPPLPPPPPPPSLASPPPSLTSPPPSLTSPPPSRLPGTPVWVWFLVASLAVVLLVLLSLCVFCTRRRRRRRKQKHASP